MKKTVSCKVQLSWQLWWQCCGVRVLKYAAWKGDARWYSSLCFVCSAWDSRPIPIHFGKRACPYLDLVNWTSAYRCCKFLCKNFLSFQIHTIKWSNTPVFCFLTQMSEHLEHVSKAKLGTTQWTLWARHWTLWLHVHWDSPAWMSWSRWKHQIRLRSLQQSLTIIDIVATMTTGEASKSGHQKLTEWY